MRSLITGIYLVALSLPSLSAADRPPNIVFIFADDLGIFDLGCYGRVEHRTPNLDRLASQGVRFTDSYAAQSVCSPTRAALMTGKAPARLHLTTFLPGRADCTSQKLLHPTIRQQLPLEEITLAEMLKSAGYVTGCFGKWHLGGKGFLPPDQGFDVFQPGMANTKPSETEGGKGEYLLTRMAKDFIQANRDKPFFLYLPHNNPHIPYTAQPKRVADNAKAFEPVYAAVIETLDDTVGQILKHLDELNLSGNTLVVFTSDNGGLHVPEGGHSRTTHSGPYRAGKGYLYEGGIRVPTIARLPGKIPTGHVEATPIITTDWFATLRALATGKAADTEDGRNLLPLLTGQAKLAERPLFWHIPHYTNQGGRPSGAVRLSNFKLVRQYEDDSLELYDLSKDPGELSNLATTEAQRASTLNGMLEGWLKATNAQRNEPNPNWDKELHRKLYIDFDPSKFEPAKATEAEWAAIAAWRKGVNGALSKKK